MKHWKKKDFLLLITKSIEKIPDALSVKQYYQSYLKRKSTKQVKQSKIITHQTKIFENPNIIDLKSVTTEYPKTSHKLSKTG